MNLQLSTHVVDLTTVVCAGGEIDASTAPQLRDALATATALPQRTRSVVADLSEVTFLASAGLSVLVETHERCREQHIAFRVVATAHATLRALRITGLDQILDVVETSEFVPPVNASNRTRSA